ncbi:homeobox protein knotted-1-like 13 isoform X2 [Phoenix dactylifera]|uniref:Homeobox protein knotted-1-like 13 isoform X2 n=2 Tax=Phoenix dactylifera TaxID=42345 RepID=A0A8B7CM11_PHODC|nr:homeobox protein knotted-1-like 13 isoform X2 [Phoenix dactylifera]
MAFHNHLSHEMGLPQYAEQRLGDGTAVLGTMDQLGGQLSSSSDASPAAKDRLMAEAAGKPPLAGGGGGRGPTWLNSAILRQQGHQYVDGSFLHLQTTSDSSASPAGGATTPGGGGGQWLPRPAILQRSGSDDEVPVSSDSMIAVAISADAGGSGQQAHGHRGAELGEGEAAGQGVAAAAAGGGGAGEHVGEGSWQNARYKAEILAHPLYEQLLSAHVACLRIATPVDQLPRIDAQLAQSQHVVAKYSVLGHGNQMLGDDKELDQFMTHYVLLLCSFKEQLQQHVRVHAMEAVMACWELEQSLQSLTGVSPGEGTGATMSDDDEDQADSDTNLFDGSLGDGIDSMGFGPLIPTETERSLMDRVRQELKHELRQGYKEKIVDIREEILRKRRAGKLPGDTTSTLKAWWQSHSKWPYPTEDDKARLVQETGLQLKQINNWFINQRKRNWHNNPSSSSTLKSKRKRRQAEVRSDVRLQALLTVTVDNLTNIYA